MGEKNKSIISQIRSFNRFYTSILGLIDKHILDSSFTLTEARILFEISNTYECTANILIEKLNIDPGHMSRILKRFESDGLLSREKSSIDGRTYLLYLTAKGKETFSNLVERSNSQIHKLIDHLREEEQKNLVDAMKYIEETLKFDTYTINIRTFKSKDIDHIIERHVELYKREYEFDNTFKDYVSKPLYDFAKSHNKDKGNIWVAELNGEVVGSIAIVKVDNSTAQLRWFLTEPHTRGKGLGKRLMKTAMEFCKKENYRKVFLLTISDLKAARYLYESYGFELSETIEHHIWGQHLIEERWDMEL